MRCRTPSLPRSKFERALLRPFTPSRSGLLKSVFQYTIIPFDAFEPSRSRCGIGEGSAMASGENGAPATSALRIVGPESHRHSSARFRSDDVRRVDAGFVHYLRDELREIGERVFEAARNVGMAKSWQVRPDEAILLGHTRHPRIPFHARFVIAVDQHHRLWLPPGFAQPVFSIEEVFHIAVFYRSDGQALGAQHF